VPPISNITAMKQPNRSPFQAITIGNLRCKNAGVIRPPSSTRPAIWRIEEEGIRAVVKDFSANRWFFRNTAGRFLIWREARAYRELKGMEGVPALYRVMDGIALVVEEIPGKSLEDLEQEKKLPPTFFDELQALVVRFHCRGIAHCDLKRAANTLLGDDGHPYIVDWAASIGEAEFRFPIVRLIYQRFLLDDQMAVIKLKLRHIPESVSLEEKARYGYRSTGEKLVRGIRDRLRDILQKAA
jgi:serine/threonine protein kinase